MSEAENIARRIGVECLKTIYANGESERHYNQDLAVQVAQEEISKAITEAEQRGREQGKLDAEIELEKRCHQDIEFSEFDGTVRKIVYQYGDSSAGIFSGWEINEDDEYIDQLKEQAATLSKMEIVQNAVLVDALDRINTIAGVWDGTDIDRIGRIAGLSCNTLANLAPLTQATSDVVAAVPSISTLKRMAILAKLNDEKPEVFEEIKKLARAVERLEREQGA